MERSAAEDGPSRMQPTPCVPRLLLALETGEEGGEREFGFMGWLAGLLSRDVTWP